jgi:hypothetical protein
MGDKHELQALCGRIMIVETEESELYDEPENLCLLCPLGSCHIYTDYLYEATHYYNPG